METLAIAISDNANKIAAAIRAKLSEDTEKQKAIPLIDESAGAEIFIAPPCEGYIQGMHGTVNALEDAQNHLIKILNDYNYESSTDY